MFVRRALSAFAVALLIIFAPTAAFAGNGYEGDDEEEIELAESNPDEGEPFEVDVDAGDAEDEGDDTTLEIESDDADDEDIDIAGSQSMTKPADRIGVAQFKATLWEEGSYTLTGYDENGRVLARTTVVVGDGVPGGAVGGGDDSAAGGVTGGLGDTGAAAGLVAAGGLGALLLIGGGTMLFRRRENAEMA